MARSSIWAALLVFAPVASAAEWAASVGGVRNYATESVTSEDVVINFQGPPPRVIVRLTLEDAEIDLIDRGDTVDLTFTLVNAKFARALRRRDLASIGLSGIQGCDVRLQSVDSEAGSASATLTIETIPGVSGTNGDCAVLGSGMHRLGMQLELPPLTGLDNTKAARVKFKAAASGGSGWPTLTEEIATLRHPVTGIQLPLNIIQYRDAMNVRALGLSFQNGRLVNAESSRIDLAAGRTGFTSPGQAHLSIVSVGRRGASGCTRRDYPYASSLRACFLQRDGRPFSLGKGGDGAGDLNVTVAGNFRAGDVVFLDVDGDRMPGAGESLALQADGTMRESFPLEYVTGNPNAAAGEAGELDREEGIAETNLYYLPNGTDPLRQGEYRTTLTVTTDSAETADFLDRIHAVTGDRVAISSLHTTSYTLVEDTRIAYAIPAPGAAESVRVRVKCEGATPCRLYLECDAPDGTDYFAQVEDPIPGRSTLALTAEALGNALGIEAGAWEEGRMSCFIHSTRKISVQQLTRSGGVLANNTYVDD